MWALTFHDPAVWNHVFKQGEVVEIRILNTSGSLDGKQVWGKTISGYFDNHQDFCRALSAIKKLDYSGAYFTLQVIDPRLIARAFNRLKVAGMTTSDNDVLAYRWLPLDFDPVRPSGISSSDEELQEAIELRDNIVPILQDRYGFLDPVLAMSGNGAHTLFRLPDLPANQEHRDLMKDILKSISNEFSTDTVDIDQSVWNPSRIWKLYGTTARKGDPVPAGGYREARPYRESFIESLGEGKYEH